MGLDANVLCVGRFSEDIVDCLDYDPEFYKDTKLGTIITTHMLSCNTSDQSRQLAAALGTDPWNFNTHCLMSSAIKWEDLEELSEICAEWDENDIEKFRRLLNENFICIYQPNG